MTTDHLATHALDIGDRIALIDDRPGQPARQVTFAELDRLTNQLARGLRHLGMGPGDRVGWMGPNSIEVLVAIHGIRKSGAVSVPIPYRSTLDETVYLLENSDTAVLLVDADHVDVARAAVAEVPSVQHLAVWGAGATDEAASLDELLHDQAAPLVDTPELTRTMIYTSGTTGQPKGAIRRVGGTANQFGGLLELLGWQDGPQTFLTTGPLYHSGPSGFALRAHIVGSTVVLQRHFDAEDWLRLVDTHRVTTTFAAPTPIRRICNLPAEAKARYDRSSMRCMIANAAPWTMTLKRAYLDDFPPHSLWEVYGSTELSINTVLAPADQLRKPGSCGRAAPGVEIVLVDELGNDVTEPGVPGELYVRSAGLFETYHKAPERYDADHRNGFQTVGDIAYFDDEGYFYICDRKRDMIITGGVNVYPAEVENTLDGHPDIAEVAVIGIPDEEWGEAVQAVVVARSSALTAESVITFARQHLAGPKVPKDVRFIDELPKTGSGKVLKRELRQPA